MNQSIFIIIDTQNIPFRAHLRRWADVISLTSARARNVANSTHLDILPVTRPTWRAPTTLCWVDRTRLPVFISISSKCAPTTRPSFTGKFSIASITSCWSSPLISLSLTTTDLTVKKIGSRFTTSFLADGKSCSVDIVAIRFPVRLNPILEPPV